MKTTMKTILALLALGISTLAVRAQNDNGTPSDGPRPARHRPPPLPIVLALDANHDGVIDANEIANASAALKTLDKNGDGQLTKDEYLPTPPADAPKNAPHPPLPPIVKALDANGDGVIDASEIANATAALKTLDKNGDGQLTRDEFIGKRPHMGPPPGQAANTGNGDAPAGDNNDVPPGPPPAE